MNCTTERAGQPCGDLKLAHHIISRHAPVTEIDYHLDMELIDDLSGMAKELAHHIGLELRNATLIPTEPQTNQ